MGSVGVDQHQNGSPVHGRRIYLLTSPRTASNLFIRILNLDEQPELVANSFGGGYFFMAPFLFRDSFNSWDMPIDQMSEDQKKAIAGAYQGATDELKNFVDNVEAKGKIPFVKEHVNFMTKPALQNQILHRVPADSMEAPWTVHMHETDTHTTANPLFLPDDWLQSFMPVFLIRHPALSFPSQYRAETESRGVSHAPSKQALHALVSNYISVRRLYDFYRSHFLKRDPDSPWPLVIEASEFLTHLEPVMHHFCNVTGLDSSKLRFTWDVATKDQLERLPNDTARRFLSTLNASTGILKDKANPEINIDVESIKWREEFGEEIGTKMEGWVRGSLDDYEYVRSHRWTPPGSSDNSE